MPVIRSDRDERVVGAPRPRRASDAIAPRTLSVLVVGTDQWAIEQSSAALKSANHSVSSCQEPGDTAFPCRALQPGGKCPLDQGVDVVVTSRARPAAAPTAYETGVICALHVDVPLVVTGISRGGPFTPWATRLVTENGDLAAACVDAVADHEAADVIVMSEGSA